MQIPVQRLKQGLLSKTGGKALSNIGNLYAMIQEAIFTVQENVSLPSSIRRVPFISPIYSQPYLRKLPDDMSAEGLIDVYKKDYKTNYPIIRTGNYTSEFMRRYGMGLVDIVNIDGIQYLNIKDEMTDRLLIDNAEDKTNGDWQLLGFAHNLKYDEYYKLDGKSSVSFDVNVGAGAYGLMKNNFGTIVSLENKKYIIVNAFLPVVVTTGITIRWGKNAGNYRERVITKNYQGNRLKAGWNTLAVEIEGATVVGVYNPTVDPTDYQVQYFYYSPNDVLTVLTQEYRIDGIFAVVDMDYELEYYSNSIVVDKFGSRREASLVGAEDDSFLMNEAEYMLFLKQFSVISGTDIRPASANTEISVYAPNLAQAYSNFSLKYPSKKILRSSEY